MEAKWCVLLAIALISVLVNGDDPPVKPVVKIVKGQKVCQKGWECKTFITAAAEYQPDGFGTTGGKFSGMKEVAAFLGHVGSKTSCELIKKPICFVFLV